MKKILLYIESLNRGGAERVMSILANEFSKKGYDVVLLTEVNNSHEPYEISTSVKRINLDIKNSNFILKNIKKISAIRKIVKAEKPDVLLSFLGNQNIRMLLATHGIKCKKFVSVRNDPHKEYGSFVKRVLAKLLFKKADGCIFQTEDAQKFFGKKIQDKSTIIANPIDEKFFKVNQDDNPTDIVTVGRLEAQKNFKMLIDAYRLLGNIDDKLFIYGEGSKEEELANHIKESGLENKVFLMGTNSNIESVLKKSKIFVLSSDYEGMPNSLMEAMAVGLPCISTDCPIGGPKYLINDGYNGKLVPCNDSFKMARALEEMLSCDYKEFGKKAKMRASDFESNKIIQQWGKFLLK